MSAPSDSVFTVRRHLDAPPDRVFAAFIDPHASSTGSSSTDTEPRGTDPKHP